jgi:hypothetical protein
LLWAVEGGPVVVNRRGHGAGLLGGPFTPPAFIHFPAGEQNDRGRESP